MDTRKLVAQIDPDSIICRLCKERNSKCDCINANWKSIFDNSKGIKKADHWYCLRCWAYSGQSRMIL